MMNNNNGDVVKESLAEIRQCICDAGYFYWEASEVMDYLNMRGFCRLFECKAFKEKKMKKRLSRFAINVLQCMMPKYEENNMNKESEYKSIIPYNFYTMDRLSVDENIVKNTVKTIFNEYLKILENDHATYLEIWYDLIEAGKKDPKACKLAGFVKCMADHHECKIKMLTREIICMKENDYNILSLQMIQSELHDKIRDKHMIKSASF